VEKIAFHSQHFAALIVHRLLGGGAALGYAPADVFPTDPMTHIIPGHFLGNPSLWIGLLIAAAFLAAVGLRRYQGSI
jgi:hypothetical protein